MKDPVKRILIHLDLPTQALQRLQEQNKQFMQVVRRVRPEHAGLKPLSKSRQAEFPSINPFAKRFEPVECGPAEISVAEVENVTHVTIRQKSPILSHHHDDYDPPGGGGGSAAPPVRQFAAGSDGGGVVHIFAALLIRRSITGHIEVEIVSMSTNTAFARSCSAILAAISAVIITGTRAKLFAFDLKERTRLSCHRRRAKWQHSDTIQDWDGIGIVLRNEMFARSNSIDFFSLYDENRLRVFGCYDGGATAGAHLPAPGGGGGWHLHGRSGADAGKAHAIGRATGGLKAAEQHASCNRRGLNGTPCGKPHDAWVYSPAAPCSPAGADRLM
jgi:hypothetical protein